MSDRRAGMAGPFGSVAEGFETELRRLGYKPGAANSQLGLLGDLSQWLEDEGIAPGELTTERVADFVGGRRQEGRSRFVSVRGMATLLGYLRAAGVIPEPSRPEQVGPTEVLLERYHRFLVNDRGLRDAVVVQYETGARLFVEFVTNAVSGWRRWARVM